MIRVVAIIVITIVVVLLYKLYYDFASCVICPGLIAATEKTINIITHLIEKVTQKK